MTEPLHEHFTRPDGLTVDLYCADCLDVLPTLGKVDAVVTDPPYGMNQNTNSIRFSGGQSRLVKNNKPGDNRGREWDAIVGDDKPFNPAPFLDFPEVIMFGSNHYAQRLPIGTTLVWVKRADHLFETFLSDAELAWQKGGYGVYCYREQFPPPARMAENNGEVAHPTQKPIGLMTWCIRRLGLPAGAVILDAYMGSGTTGVAAVRLGRSFIGVELEPKYYAIARRRILEALAQPALFNV